MSNSIPILLVDAIDYSKRQEAWRDELITELQSAMTSVGQQVMGDADPWKYWKRHGTGDGYYVFLEGLDCRQALRFALGLDEKLTQRNAVNTDLNLRLRMTLVFGEVREVGDQFQGEALVEAVRILDSSILRRAAGKGAVTTVLATSSLFHHKLLKSLQTEVEASEFEQLQWKAFTIVAKHDQVYSAKLLFAAESLPLKTFLRNAAMTAILVLGLVLLWMLGNLEELDGEYIGTVVSADGADTTPTIEDLPSTLSLETYTEQIQGIDLKFIRIPNGDFFMGSPIDEPGRSDNETRHQVTLTYDFWMSETEVTQRQWARLMESNPSRFSDCDECPVDQVTWQEATEFANRLSASAGFEECYFEEGGERFWIGQSCDGYRLPTEAEWEYAARAGTIDATYAGPIRIVDLNNAPVLDEIAWYGGNSGVSLDSKESVDSSKWEGKQYPHSRAGVHKVKGKRPNHWGLYDMLGNVWEWTGDWYANDYPAGNVVNPVGPSTGSSRVFRGGSWHAQAQYVRCAYRYFWLPSNRSQLLGFRLVRGQALFDQE